MREQGIEDKTVRHLERLSEALGSGVKSQVKQLINSLSGAEIGDLLESLPLPKRLVVWELVDTDLDGEGDVCDNGGLCGPFYQHLPQYAFDLNVMRELELTLVGDEREAYCHAICACASAMQRASAYWKLVQ